MGRQSKITSASKEQKHNLFFKNYGQQKGVTQPANTAILSKKVASRLQELASRQMLQAEERFSPEVQELVEERSKIFSKAESAESFLLVTNCNKERI